MSKHIDTKPLRTQLERAAIRDRDLDREVAADWFAVDTEARNKLDIAEPGRKTAGRGGARSTSRR
jgi:hypothetical protein